MELHQKYNIQINKAVKEINEFLKLKNEDKQ